MYPSKGGNSFLESWDSTFKGRRDILEEHGFFLCDSSKLRQLLPFILDKERLDIRQAIEGKSYYTHLRSNGSSMRYVDDDWQVKLQVYHLMLLAKSMTGEEVAHQLITILSSELSIPANFVVDVLLILLIILGRT